MECKRVWYRFLVIIRHDMLLHADIASLIVRKRASEWSILFAFDATCFQFKNRKKAIDNHNIFAPDMLQVLPGHLLGCFLSFLRYVHKRRTALLSEGFIKERMIDEWRL